MHSGQSVIGVGKKGGGVNKNWNWGTGEGKYSRWLISFLQPCVGSFMGNKNVVNSFQGPYTLILPIKPKIKLLKETCQNVINFEEHCTMLIF